MKAPSRVVLLAVVVAGTMLSGTATALAQEEDGGVVGLLNGVTCSIDLELLGQCDEQAPAPAPETPPAADTPPAGEGGNADDSGGVDEGAVSAPGAGAGDVAVSGEDNGAAPVGGVETGAGGATDDSGMAAAALAGVGIVTAGGVLLARRNLGRRGGHTL